MMTLEGCGFSKRGSEAANPKVDVGDDRELLDVRNGGGADVLEGVNACGDDDCFRNLDGAEAPLL
jgi:hypothetical protein